MQGIKGLKVKPGSDNKCMDNIYPFGIGKLKF